MEALRFFNVTLARTVTASTFGNVAPGSSDDILFRIVNDSDTYRADGVTVAVAGVDADQLYLSTNGDDFYPQISVGAIPPGGLSIAFTMRRVTPTGSPTNGMASMTATPTAWSHPDATSDSDDVPLDTE